MSKYLKKTRKVVIFPLIDHAELYTEVSPWGAKKAMVSQGLARKEALRQVSGWQVLPGRSALRCLPFARRNGLGGICCQWQEVISEVSDAFRGEISHRIDSKGRVSVPADFRRLIEAGDPSRAAEQAASLTIVYGDPKRSCLIGLSRLRTSEIDRIIGRTPRSDVRHRQLTFVFQSRAATISLDPNGRLALSQPMRRKAALDCEALFVGAGDSFEIWNPANYADHADLFQSQLVDLDCADNAMALLEEPR